MRSRTPLLALLLVAGSLVLPLAAHAAIPFFGPIIPNEQITVNGIVTNQNVCAAGWGLVMIVINNIISFLITIAIVFVAPLMIAWSGFLYVVNPVDPSGISKAKSILWNTIIGIVIALSGWLIVDAIMAVLYNPNARNGETTLGVWSQLVTSGGAELCIPLAGSLNQVTPGTGVTVTPGPTTTPGAGASANIAVAANAYINASTSAGPYGGRLACAWAVNNVLSNAGIPPIDANSVVSMERELQSGRGALINQSTAMPGDIVIEAGDGHVGICLNAGCSSVISNSSSNASFTWVSNTSFSPSYSNGPGRIYRVIN